jgi:hypothetical protein
VGRETEARALGAELIEHMKRTADWRVLDFSFVAKELGYVAELRARLEELSRTPLNLALLALVSDDFPRAAELFDEAGLGLAAADSRRLWAGRLTSEGRHGEAGEQLELALAFYRSVRATRYVRKCEAVLAAAG